MSITEKIMSLGATATECDPEAYNVEACILETPTSGDQTTIAAKARTHQDAFVGE